MKLTIKPKVCKSYLDLDKKLYDFGLQATNKNITAEAREALIRLFETSHADKGFYKIKLTKAGEDEKFETLDALLKEYKEGCLKAYVFDDDSKQVSYIIGGIYWIQSSKMSNINQSLFLVTSLRLTNSDEEKEIMKAIKSCMKAQKAEI